MGSELGPTVNRVFQIRTGQIQIEREGFVAWHDLCGEAGRGRTLDDVRSAIADHLNHCPRFEWPTLPSGPAPADHPTLKASDIHVGGGTETMTYYGVITDL